MKLSLDLMVLNLKFGFPVMDYVTLSKLLFSKTSVFICKIIIGKAILYFVRIKLEKQNFGAWNKN